VGKQERRNHRTGESERCARTLAAVAGGPLPGEEAEGAVPRVLELAVRHPRLLLLLTCRTSQQTHQIRREHNVGGSPRRRRNGRRRRASEASRGWRRLRRRRVRYAHLWGGGGAAGTGWVSEEPDARKP